MIVNIWYELIFSTSDELGHIRGLHEYDGRCNAFFVN